VPPVPQYYGAHLLDAKLAEGTTDLAGDTCFAPGTHRRGACRVPSAAKTSGVYIFLSGSIFDEGKKVCWLTL
jgi:hypothetical protein